VRHRRSTDRQTDIQIDAPINSSSQSLQRTLTLQRSFSGLVFHYFISSRRSTSISRFPIISTFCLKLIIQYVHHQSILQSHACTIDTVPVRNSLLYLPTRVAGLGSESAIDVNAAWRFAELQRHAPLRLPRARKRAINTFDITPPWRLTRIAYSARSRQPHWQTVQNQQIF
jgi:hypothetical protein